LPPKNPVRTGWILVGLSLVTCGLGAFAPAVWLAAQRRGDDKFRTRAFVLAALATLVSVVGFAIFYSAPKDAEGTPTGSQASLGGTLWLLSGLGSAVLAGIFVAIQSNRQKSSPPR
jgi:hypothetical protein